jgi:hypothetical protein
VVAEGTDQGRTQIIVATISLVGVIAAALIATWSKVADRDPPRPAVVNQQGPAAENGGGGADPPTPQQGLRPAGTDTPAGVAANAGGASIPDIAGAWRDTDGLQYWVEQTGAEYAYRQYQNGVQVGIGQGRLTGHSFRSRVDGQWGPGECEGEVTAAAVSGVCRGPAGTAPFRLSR